MLAIAITEFMSDISKNFLSVFYDLTSIETLAKEGIISLISCI
jgi:hypothetical protein